MDKKTLTIIGIIGAVILILICVVIGMQTQTKELSSNDIMRINNIIYSKEEFLKYVKYKLYKNNGELNVDIEAHAEDISNGASEESIFLSDALNSFYQLKVYGILAKQKNIVVPEESLASIDEDYNTNEEKITSFGLSKDDYYELSKQQALEDTISQNPSDYIELPDEVYDSYISQFSGDQLKSYTYRMVQVNYTEDYENESGEAVSGDKNEKEEYVNKMYERVKSGESFETVAESGDARFIYVGNGIQYAKNIEEHAAGIILEQKMGEELAKIAKETPSGELTEIVDSNQAFQFALIENVEDGIVGEAKDELVELLIGSYYNELVFSVVKDREINNSAVSRIKIR